MTSNEQVPPAFLEALQSIAAAKVRRDMRVWETAAPTRIAPYAAAINGEVVTAAQAEGRLVVLHNPAGDPQWDSQWRIVALIRAQVEPEVGTDDLVGSVAWSWLEEALSATVAHHLGGTVTTEKSESFGAIDQRPAALSIELRASWSPATPDFTAHVEAWLQAMATCAGIPPLPDGVAALPGAL